MKLRSFLKNRCDIISRRTYLFSARFSSILIQFLVIFRTKIVDSRTPDFCLIFLDSHRISVVFLDDLCGSQSRNMSVLLLSDIMSFESDSVILCHLCQLCDVITSDDSLSEDSVTYCRPCQSSYYDSLSLSVINCH